MDGAAKDSVKSIVDVFFWAAFCALGLALSFFLFFNFSSFKLINVHGPSMEPTLYDGDLLVVQQSEDLLRDHIVVFELPGDWIDAVDGSTHAKLIKKLAALPGDQITFEGDKISIEGQGVNKLVNEPSILRCPLEIGDSIVVPDGSAFILGDNRVQSFDSMAAWCQGLDPFVSQKSIGINGPMSLHIGLPRFQ